MTSVVTHYAYPDRTKIIVGVIIERAKRAGIETEFASSVALTPIEALDMADKMRDELGKFLKKDGDFSVEVWREAGETDELIWGKGEDEIRIRIDPRDGWSWNYAEDIEESAERLL